MLHRIREAWAEDDDDQLDGPAEVDDTYFRGKRKNMPLSMRKTLKGRSAVDKTAVVGVKDRYSGEVRAEVVEKTVTPTLQGFVRKHVEPGATICTDDAAAYREMPEFENKAVNHSIGEYVDSIARTNGIESFWAMLKRAHKGTFHKISLKHLDRYVSEFAGKRNIRDSGALVQMRDTVARLVGRRLLLRDLIADNGLSNAGRLRRRPAEQRLRQLLGRRAFQVPLGIEHGIPSRLRAVLHRLNPRL